MRKMNSSERAAVTRRLLPLAQAGDIKARNHLIELHLPLVYKAAVAFKRPDLLDDLVQAGIAGPAGSSVVGLCRAIQDYDPNRGVAFSTYAIPCIRSAMQQELATHGGCVRLCHSNRYTRKLVRQTAAELDTLDPKIIAAELRAKRGRTVSVRMVKEALSASGQVAYDEQSTLGSDGERGAYAMSTTLLLEHLSTPGSNVVDDVSDGLRMAALETAIDSLKMNERHALMLGLCGMTQTEIAPHMGVSRQRVDDLQKRAVVKVREHAALKTWL